MRIFRCVLLTALFLSTFAVYAEPTSFGDWTIGTTSDKEAVYAVTVNDGAELFGNTATSNRKVAVGS